MMKKGTAAAPHTDPPFDGDKSRDILILVIGASGAGKGYFINRLLSAIGSQRRVSESDTLSPCTIAIEPVIVQERGWIRQYPHISAEGRHARFIILDTPGLDTGPTSSDFEILKRIASWVNRSYPGALSDPQRTFLVGGVVYLHDLSRDKAPNVTQRNVRMLGRLLDGQLPISSVILVTTKWGGGETAVCEAREKELKEKYWKELLEPQKGKTQAREMRFMSESVKMEEKVVLEIVHPILRRFDKFVGEAALEGFRHTQKSLHGLRIKTEEFKRDLDAALDKSVLLHIRTSALEEGVVSQEEIEVWAEELEKSNQEVYRLFSQFSTWDRVRFSFARRRYFR